MKIKHIFCLITICILGYSCKENQASHSKIVNKTSEIKTEKKYRIPSDLTIEKKEEINIDNDDIKEVIITAIDKKAEYFYEFWFKNDQLIYQFKYPWGEINKKWLVNLDDDELKEIIRMHGYSDDLECAIYDISNNQQIPILYFNPILEDIRYPNKYMWGYPNDIKNLIIKEKNNIQVSLNNYQLIDTERPLPDNQKELPYLFFQGQTSQPDMTIQKINSPEVMTLQSVINRVRGSENFNLSVDFSIQGRWITDYAKENLPEEIRYDNDKGTFFMRDSEILMYDDNTGIFFMKDSKGGYIAKILVEYNIKTKSIEFVEATIIDTKYKYFEWNIDIKPNTPIAVIKKGDNKKINLEWKGLYNSKTKKIEFSKNPFNQTSNSVILNNCDY